MTTTIHTRHSPYYILMCGLSLSCLCFTLYQIRLCLRKKIIHSLSFLIFNKVCVKNSYFKNKWKYVMKNEWMPFLKYTTCLPDWKELNFTPQFWGIFQNLIYCHFLSGICFVGNRKTDCMNETEFGFRKKLFKIWTNQEDLKESFWCCNE